MSGLRNYQAIAQGVGALLIASCASLGGIGPDSSDDAKRAAVAARANSRAVALITADLDRAYEHLSSGSKTLINKDNFRVRMSRWPFTAYRIEGIDCDRESCRVKSRLTFDHPAMRGKGVSAPSTEVWVLERGEYFFVFPAS
ncbi:MAG: hypothetical protein U1F51_01895 [Burkholderiales bacterium]